MTLSKCPYLFICIFIVFGFVFCNGQSCTDPQGKRGTCLNVYNCPRIFSILQKARKPLPESAIQWLRQAQCANSQKVCCAQNNNEEPRSVVGHKNLDLLDYNCGLSDSNRLLGGKVTDPLEFPWMALIAYNTSSGIEFRCGATIINEKYVLTAAHCITKLQGMRLAYVRVGEHNLLTERDCIGRPPKQECFTAQNLPIKTVIPHPDYVGSKPGENPQIQHDIGLLRLDQDINMNMDNVLPICLPTTTKLQRLEMDNLNVTVTGWGFTETREASSALLQIKIFVIPNKECGDVLNNSLQDGVGFRQMCAGGVENVNSCGGDSGGPLQIQEQVNGARRMVQFGIVSYGARNCERSEIPGVYTKIAHYMHWILSQMKR